MTRYAVYRHSWCLMSCLDNYDALFQDWAVVTDKRNYGLTEAPEFDLRAYSRPLGGVK
jgi:hypothetical protein